MIARRVTFGAFFFGSVNYGTLIIGRKMALEEAGAALVEWTLVGLVIGLVYKPAASAVPGVHKV